MRWKNVAGLGDLSGDTDCDGLTDWQEVFLHATDPAIPDTDGDGLSDSAEVLVGANPLDADENGDCVPDGVSPSDWAENPLWTGNAPSGTSSISISLNEAIPTGASASLVVGDLCIPLRSPTTWVLELPEGETVEGRLFSDSVRPVHLSIAPPNIALRRSGSKTSLSNTGSVLVLDDPTGVFSGYSRQGGFRMAVPKIRFFGETGDPAPPEECIHDDSGTRIYVVKIFPKSSDSRWTTQSWKVSNVLEETGSR